MKNIASKSRTLAAVAFATVACLVVVAVASVPVVEAGQAQSSATETQNEERVRAELEARMSQLITRLQELEAVRELDLQDLQRRLETTVVNGARLRELMKLRVAGAAAQSNQQVEEVRIRVEEITRRAMEVAEEAVQRAGLVRAFNLRSNCDLFGEQVLDRAEELGITDDQAEQIRAAQRAGRRDGIERRADTEIAEMDLEALYEVDEPDLAAVRAKLEELAMLQVDSQMAGLSLRRQVRQILTPTQLEEWGDLRGDDEIHLVISGVSTSWSSIGWSNFGRFGC
ncbi:MAG: hypothetical protein IH849_13420 [Acidobacteria bacterium]|nr:hypothetical protein [Acidobacteriota bacterium]